MKLTLKQLARCLDLPPGTIQRWVAQGRIPVHMVERDCIFNQSTLEKWAGIHNLKFTPPQEREKTRVPPAAESLLAAMERGGVYHDIEADSIKGALQKAVDRLPEIAEASKAEILGRLLEREELTSTGIGNGVAIPHPRSPVDRDQSLIATFFLKSPIHFNALDDLPVFVMFLLLCPSVQQHLHLLSRLSFCIRRNTFISFLKAAPSPDLLFHKIAEFETELDQADT